MSDITYETTERPKIVAPRKGVSRRAFAAGGAAALALFLVNPLSAFGNHCEHPASTQPLACPDEIGRLRMFAKYNNGVGVPDRLIKVTLYPGYSGFDLANKAYFFRTPPGENLGLAHLLGEAIRELRPEDPTFLDIVWKDGMPSIRYDFRNLRTGEIDWQVRAIPMVHERISTRTLQRVDEPMSRAIRVCNPNELIETHWTQFRSR